MLYSKSLTDLFDPIKTELELAINTLEQTLNSDNALVNRIISYVLSTGGKHIRPAISLLCSKLFSETLEEKHLTLAQVVEIIHTASLIHDDVIDNADIRRNHKTVRALWGNKVSVISGDYLLAIASNLIASLENNDVILIWAKSLEEICNGEIQQTNLMYDTSITLDEYILKSTRKTALLFASAAKCSAIISEAHPDEVEALENYGTNYGLAFQIIDDILNFHTTDQVGKPSCDDLRSGIITAPVIYAIEEFPELVSIIDTHFEKEEDFQRALDIVKSSSGFGKAMNLAEYYANKAVKSLDIFYSSPSKTSLIHLAGHVTKRRF